MPPTSTEGPRASRFPTAADAGRVGAVLTVDLAAIVANWRLLRDRSAPAECAAVVKADAYGLGVEQVAPALAEAGCRVFFVATLDEGVALRWVLEQWRQGAVEPDTASPAPPAIFVLGGLPPGSETELPRHGLIPVLNSLGDLETWSLLAQLLGMRLPAALHVDTGMSRLGLPADELDRLANDPDRLEGVNLALVMSHLACADEPAHELNQRQLEAFTAARARLPATPASLANSAGIFLGAAFHFQLVRPGVALYGVAPIAGEPNPMQGVVRLDARILQVREIDTGGTVGYGATHRARGRERIATVSVGYADGYLRSLSGRASAVIGGYRVPLVGRVSMDLTTFDVTGVPEELARPGATLQLLGPEHPVDALAEEAGTIGYEILTSLGARYARAYLPADR